MEGNPPSKLVAILDPARRQVNAKGYDGNFMRQRREWKRGSLALADAMQYRTFPIPSSSRWENLICPITHLLVGRMVANSTKLDR